MRRVVGSTSAAETQSLLNGLGHAEWIAAHSAEARFPKFDVAQRSIFLRRFQIQRVVDAKSLYDHLISLSSPSSVEDKRYGFDLSFLDNACSVLVLLSDGLPQIVCWLML